MSSGSYALPNVVDFASVVALRAALLELRGADLEVDAGAVQRIGGLGLQVLLSASRMWRADELNFSIVRASEPFTEILRLTGAAELPEFAA